MNRPPMPNGIGKYHVIARSRQATWQSVTPAAQRAARPLWGRRDADCHGPDGPRNDRGGRWLVPFRRTCSGHRWRVLRNGHNRSLHWVSLFVGAIHESPADAERHRNISRHCEEPPGDVAIPWYKGHPENRRDCHAAFAARNDVITGRAILESPLQNTRKRPRFSEPGSSHTNCSFRYAERKLATGRAVLLDSRQVKCIRHEFTRAGSALISGRGRSRRRRPASRPQRQ